RNGFKWGVNEILRLQREYELLNLSIPDIAKNHERTEDSVLYRLHQEGIIDEIGFDINDSDNLNLAALSSKKNQNRTIKTDKTDNENSLLSQRVIVLESSVYEMKTMVKQMVDEFMEQKRQKTQELQKIQEKQTSFQE
ncbi:MAG: hypothetical protein EBS33_05460, partial [Alphaproteobacteria bacterium]|nr:hypothetical protein [Alphaproteobacteria bacterium]